MKACPTCNATYDDRVDFCFEDGSPLEAQSEVEVAKSGAGGTEFDVPEAAGLNLKSAAGTSPDAAAGDDKQKRRRGRSGMFGRPSVADMLAVPEPGGVAPVGGRPATPEPVQGSAADLPEPAEVAPEPVPVEVAAEVPEPAEVAPEPVPAEVAAEVPEPVEVAAEVPEPTEVPEPAEVVPDPVEVAAEVPEPAQTADPEASDESQEETPTEIFDSSEAAFFGAGDELGGALDAPAAIDVPAPAIEVPASALEPGPAPELDPEPEPVEPPADEEVPSAAAIAVPEPEEVSEVAGLDAPDAASFFNDESGEPDPLIEDPGFAEVGRVPAPEPVGFEDQPFFAGGAPAPQSSKSREWVMWAGGGTALIAAGLAVVFILGPSEEVKVHKRPTPTPPVAVPVEVAEELPSGDEIPEDIGEALPAEDPMAEDLAAEELPVEEVEAAPIEEPQVEAEVAPPEVAEVETAAERERREERERVRREERAQKAAEAAAAAPQVEPASAWAGVSDDSSGSADASADASSPWGTTEVSRGRLTITSNPPGAAAFVDGRRVGRTPTTTEVDYGSHSVKVELADHKPSSKTISVRTAQMSLPFRLDTAKLYARCNLSGPIGAKVLMDGKPLGSLPRSVKCSAGAHRFMVVPSSGSSYSAVRKIEPKEAGESINVYLGGG